MRIDPDKFRAECKRAAGCKSLRQISQTYLDKGGAYLSVIACSKSITSNLANFLYEKIGADPVNYAVDGETVLNVTTPELPDEFTTSTAPAKYGHLDVETIHPSSVPVISVNVDIQQLQKVISNGIAEGIKQSKFTEEQEENAPKYLISIQLAPYGLTFVDSMHKLIKFDDNKYKNIKHVDLYGKMKELIREASKKGLSIAFTVGF